MNDDVSSMTDDHHAPCLLSYVSVHCCDSAQVLMAVPVDQCEFDVAADKSTKDDDGNDSDDAMTVCADIVADVCEDYVVYAYDLHPVAAGLMNGYQYDRCDESDANDACDDGDDDDVRDVRELCLDYCAPSFLRTISVHKYLWHCQPPSTTDPQL